MQEIDKLYYTIMYNLLSKDLRWTQGGLCTPQMALANLAISPPKYTI